MAQRGRKSLASLMVGPKGPVIDRPPAPYCLTDAEVEVWNQIVNSMAADYFAPSHHPLLCQLCRHTVASNRVGQLIEACCKRRRISTLELQTLHSMQQSESAAIVRLARSLRLTPQSVYRAESSKIKPLTPTQSQFPSPWDAKYDLKDSDDD
jgi:hypothetical protein